ncbi:DUF2953 domain-containing protein [Thermodesulfitimonas sp.]
MLIALGVAGLMLLFVFGRLSLKLAYEQEEADDCLFFEATAFWGLYRYRLQVPAVAVERAGDSEAGLRWREIRGERAGGQEEQFARLAAVYHLVRRFWNFCTHNWQVVHYLWDCPRVTRLEWQTVIGTGDPATTGVAAGVLWGAKGCLMGCFAGRLRAPAAILVLPDFFTPAFKVSFNMAAYLELRHLIGVAFIFLRSRRQRDARLPFHPAAVQPGGDAR